MKYYYEEFGALTWGCGFSGGKGMYEGIRREDYQI